MKEKAIEDAMASIENRIRHVYNQGFDDGYAKGKEQTDEIRVGDEVNAEGYHRPVVVVAIRKPLISEELEYKVMNYFGDTSWELKGSVSKTGRHFPQIEEVIRKLKGEEDEV